MQTIFVTLPTGWAIRNFLRTGIVLKVSQQPKTRIVLFVHRSFLTTLKNEYGSKNILFEGIPTTNHITLEKIIHKSLRVRFKSIHYANINKLKAEKLLSSRQKIIDTIFAFPFKNSKTIYFCLRNVLKHFNNTSSVVDEYFIKYAPNILFSTQPTDLLEYEFLKSSKKYKTKTIGMIRSWDVLLSKGYIPKLADHYLVWNTTMKRKLNELYSFPKNNIHVTGAPQFDIYFNETPKLSRKEFCSKLGINTDKNIILFVGSPPLIGPQEPKIINKLSEQLKKDPNRNYALLIRLHPQDHTNRFDSDKKENVYIYRMKGSADKDPSISLQQPEFLENLHACIYYSDVVVNTGSTMSIDASAVNRPVINIAFDVEPVDWNVSTLRYFDSFEHLNLLWNTKATRLAKSINHLIELIDEYIANPKLDEQNRKTLAELICHKFDGKSSQRVVETLLQISSQLPK